MHFVYQFIYFSNKTNLLPRFFRFYKHGLLQLRLILQAKQEFI